MSELTIDAYEEFRPIGEVYEELRGRASEMLGRIGVRVGLSELATTYNIEDVSTDSSIAEMADEEEKKDENGSDDNSGNSAPSGHDSSKCTATVCSACGRGGGGSYFSAVPRKKK